MDANGSADDDFYNLQTDRSRIISEKESLDTMYSSLLTAFQKLQTDHDEAQRRIESLDEHLSEARREAVAAAEGRRGSAGAGEPEAVVKEELQRLRGDLGRTEEELAEAEGTVDKQTKIIEDLNRRVDELAGKADEAARLKDRVDELRHEADRLRKAESVAEKYRKKLDDAADLRRQNKVRSAPLRLRSMTDALLQALEEQNSELLDKHSALEDEYHKVAAFKPLMEQYKTRVADLEAQSSQHQRDGDAVRLELERTREKLAAAADERDRATGEVALLEDRVKELEVSPRKTDGAGAGRQAVGPSDDDEEDEVSGGLDDAMAGRTMTSIKLQLRQAQRALADAKKDSADSSKVVVLENLLEDAQRMKQRYEGDYLKAQREKLLAEGKLEEIISGKGRNPDGYVRSLRWRCRKADWRPSVPRRPSR